MSIRLPRISSFAAALAIAFPLCAHASPYNPVTQFSTASNPNGVWTYGYGSVGSGAITLFTQTAMSGNYKGWVVPNYPDPVIVVGSGPLGSVNAPAGDLVMHPGNADNQAAILVFTAPTSGTYSLGGLFERDDTYNGFGPGVDVDICKNTIDCSLYTNYLSSSAYLNQDLFNLTVNLNAGDTLDFEVARTAQNYSNDSTGLQLNINTGVAPTPEPSSLLLLGTGLIAAVGAAKRRFKR